MTPDGKEYLRKAIAAGGNYTTTIRPLGDLGTSAIKQISIAQPWGHESADPIKGILGKAIAQKSRRIR